MVKNRMVSVCIFLSLFPAFTVQSQVLDERLKIMEPMIGAEWEGTIQSPDGSRSFKTVQRVDVIWNGTILKYTSSVPDQGDQSEGFIYWDPAANQIAFFTAHSRGVIKSGTVSMEEGLLTFRGTIAFPERKFDFKNTFEFSSEGVMIDRWYQNAFGPWQPGHVVELRKKK